jgi:hypothetical protein
MPVVQVALNFKDEILAGIASGAYTANGSVVRDLTGAIVTHVQEVKLPVKADTFNVSRITEGLKDPKVLAVIGIGVVVTLGIAALVAGKKKQDAAPDLPKSVRSYDSALSAYLIAVHNGSIDANILDALIAALDSVRQDIESGTIAVESSTEQSANLLSIVSEYTTKLAAANGVEIGELEAATPNGGDDSIASLRRYLEIQKRIIDGAA